MLLTPRLHKFLDLPILRCRCSRYRTFFTFLPLFVAPGKWYSYPAIEEALLFVSDSRHATSSDGLRELDHRRDGRLDDGDSPGPSETTGYQMVAKWSTSQDLSPCSGLVGCRVHGLPHITGYVVMK